MEIKKDLPQFEGIRALFLVVGAYTAKYYQVHNGMIEMIGTFSIPSLQYYGQEDFLETTKLGLPRVEYGKSKIALRHKFSLHLARKMEELFKKQTFKEVYMFCIQHMVGEIGKTLPKVVLNHIRLWHGGDLLNHHLFELLKIVKKDHDGRAERAAVSTAEEIEIRSGKLLATE